MSRILFMISLVLLTVTAVGAQATGVVTHQPVSRHTATEPLVVEAIVSSLVDVERVNLFYREAGEEGYIDLEMERIGEGWKSEIPLERLGPEGVEYYILATLVDETVLSFPEDDPQEVPILVQIIPPLEPTEEEKVSEELAAAVGAEGIIIFSPLPGAKIPFDDVMVSASLFNVDSVDVSSVKMYVDGADITPLSSIDPDLVIYQPMLMREGTHRVRIEAKTLDGRAVEPKFWSFNVMKEPVEEAERGFTHRGRINGGYSFDEIDEGDPLKIGQTTVAFSGEWGPFRLGTDLKITSEEDPFKQPRNRYRFIMDAGKYLTLKLGDFNTRLSPFTLDGKRVRGMDVDLKLGFINLRVVKGELERKIQGRLGPDDSYVLEGVEVEGDSVGYKLNRKGYAFQKDILSTRLSFGRGKVFQLGFNWLKAKDNISSVKAILNDAKIAIDVDSSGAIPLEIPVGIYTYDQLSELIRGERDYSLLMDEKNWRGDTPQDNIVIGSDVKLSLFRRKIGVEAGWAFSMLNKDIWEGAFDIGSLDTLMDDTVDNRAGDIDLSEFPDPADYEDIFVINENMVPLVPIDPDSAQLANDPLTAIINMPSLSYNLRTMVNFLGNRFAFEYIKVGPEFNSLGNPYIQKNNREYRVSDRVGLFRNRLLLNLMYKHQDDDILRTVEHVTTTNTLTTNAGIYPGGGLPSITFGYRVQDRDNGNTTLDTVRTDSLNGTVNYGLEDLRDFTKTVNVTVGLTHRMSFSGFNHNISLNYIMLDRADQFDGRPSSPYYSVESGGDTLFVDSTFVSPNLTSDVVNVSIMTEYPFPLRTTVILSVNKSVFGNPDDPAYDYGDQDITSFTLNGTYDLLKGRLKIVGGLDYTTGKGNEEFTRMGIRAGVNYRITDVLRARFDGGLRSKSIDEESKRSTLIRSSLNYTF